MAIDPKDDIALNQFIDCIVRAAAIKASLNGRQPSEEQANTYQRLCMLAREALQQLMLPF